VDGAETPRDKEIEEEALQGESRDFRRARDSGPRAGTVPRLERDLGEEEKPTKAA